MSEIVNLNRARKDRARESKRTQADANSVKYGRSKAARIAEATLNEKARKMLDQHELDEE